MAEKDITRIGVADFSVSVVGLKQAIEAMAASFREKTDAEVASAMMERLGQDNYIPKPAVEAYRKAFVREFRKFCGQPYAEEAASRLEIKVLGAGCNQCDTLTRLVMEVLAELKLPAGVEHVTDLREIARSGIMGVPALLINGKAVSVGSVPPRDRIKKWLSEAAKTWLGK